MELEEIKIYLRIDCEEDDKFIKELIEISWIYITTCVGTNFIKDPEALKLSNILQRKIIADMYENRSTMVDNLKKDNITETILTKLSLIE